jgi:hypothetical protein
MSELNDAISMNDLENARSAYEKSKHLEDLGRINVDEADHPLSGSKTDCSATDVASASTQPLNTSSPINSAALRSIETGTALNNGSDSDEQARPPTIPPTFTAQQANSESRDAGNDARDVRRNMLLAAWNGSHLTKGRKWILVLRMLIGLAQFVVGIAILSLPSSLGDSFSTPETCNPEGMFVYLTLHIIRVFFSVPIDIYLGLSPHRTPRSRRVGADGLLERERTRAVGSLALDRKLSRFSDLLSFCHVVIFIVGNYTVWTSVECSHGPAESRPLWITCVCMLSVTYIIILEVGLMIFVSVAGGVEILSSTMLNHIIQLIVFFLPLLIAILRAFGLANRLPQRGIHPETGKIAQNTIDEQSQLVYFTLAKEEGPESTLADASTSRERLEEVTCCDRQQQGRGTDESIEAINTPLPLSRSTTIQSKSQPEATSSALQPPARKRRLGLLLGLGRKKKRNQESVVERNHSKAAEPSQARLKYPIYPIPAHRATCPICLCDFEEFNAETGGRRRRGREADSQDKDVDQVAGNDQEGGVEDDDEIEPLRLLQCGHVMHMSCVDQWLTTVSGRCPVCQKPIVSTDNQEEGTDAS